MTAFFKRFICRLVILSSIVLPYSANTQAAMIATGQAIANVEAQRAKVKDFVARADAQRKLAALGVGAAAAGERVNALTDDEAQLIAGRIDTLPAGGVGVTNANEPAAFGREFGIGGVGQPPWPTTSVPWKQAWSTRMAKRETTSTQLALRGRVSWKPPN